LGREHIVKPTMENESLHQHSNDSRVRRVNLVSSKNVVLKRTMFPHRNIYKTLEPLPKARITTGWSHIDK